MGSPNAQDEKLHKWNLVSDVEINHPVSVSALSFKDLPKKISTRYVWDYLP